jgi:hypothetical protein
MKNMKNRILTIAIAGMVTLASCADLTVENLNNPDTERALSSVSDLTTLAEGLIKSWHNGIHSYSGMGMPTAVLADAASCSWGNVGMREMGTEPRPAFDNAPNYGYRYLTATPFSRMYSINSSATDVIKAIKDPNIDFGADAARVEAIARFAQGISMGYIALAFDRGYIIDENSEGEALTSPTLIPYSELMDHAIAKLVEAATIAGANSFTISESVINTPGGLDNAGFAALAHSFAARFLANEGRTEAERAATDWNAVITHVSNGITSDFNINNDQWETGFWYNEHYIYLVYPGWARVDMRVINMMDDSYPSHNPDGLDFPAPDSARIFDNADVDDRLWTDYTHLSSNNFRPERGLYFFSSFRYTRHNEYIGPWSAVMQEISMSEMHMYHAEALAQTGNLAGAAAILNDPAGARKVRGGLPDVAADAAAIHAAIHHERMVESFLDGVGNEWFDMRGRDMLQKGSPLHWPIPAEILETLGVTIPFYTYGGASEPVGNGGEGTDWAAGTASGAKAWR